MEHTTPNKDEIKLIMENALLEQEKRLTKSLADGQAQQNKLYMDHILGHAERLTTLETRISAHDEKFKSIKGTIAGWTAAAVTVGGLVGFLISQLVNGGK